MSETNEWERMEAQLRSWKPRGPSAAVERRLFHRRTTGPAPARLAAWLAPAAACVLFAGLMLNPHGAATLPGAAASAELAALTLSNQSHAAYLPGSFARTHNQLERFPRPPAGGFFSPTNWLR